MSTAVALYLGLEAKKSSIVAIHGLNGDRVVTWSEGNIFWLRDLLPGTLNQSGISARIWSYGYNANAYSGAAVSVQTLWDHGESFLGQLVNRRRITNVRSIKTENLIVS